MSALTDFESLKQQILEVVTKDPAVKYILMGWMTDEFVPKSDYTQILDEIKKLREETKELREDSEKRFGAVQNEIKELRQDMLRGFAESEKRSESADKRFEAMDKRFEEQAAETRQLREDTNQRFEDMHQEMKQGFQAVQRQFEGVHHRIDQQDVKMEQGFQAVQQQFEGVHHRIDQQDVKMEAGFKNLHRHIDRLGNRWGDDAEMTFRKGLTSMVRDFFEGTITKWRVYDTQGFVHGSPCEVELDIVMTNGRCVVVEIKSAASRGDVTIFNRTAQLYQQQTGTPPDRKLLITPSIKDTARTWAEELGIEVIDPGQMQE